ERERQRLESLRKKQEAEEQRKQKVEEEKRRRQAEMKQKREERLRKALQARERVEQMEEEKKKRMEQKMLQSDEKVRGREEKVAEEKSKKKLSKKAEEAGGLKQKALRLVRKGIAGKPGLCFFQEDDECEQQQQLLQKRREDDGKERGKRVWELKNLVEQRQAEQGKERYKEGEAARGNRSAKTGRLAGASGFAKGSGCSRQQLRVQRVVAGLGTSLLMESWVCSPRDHKQRGKEKAASPQLELGVCRERRIKAGPQLPCQVKILNIFLWSQKSISASCLAPPKEPRSPKISENNYGMDLNSDDSTDDEDDPRKPIPSWADGSQLNQAILHQYYHPVNVDQIFGLITSPKLEDIFGKSKPRYFKRTSSAVWHSPP
ncbi:INCE protein, partial [Crypturellus undulatus]|nr:INCE protein [Crypturellus undulatus]